MYAFRILGAGDGGGGGGAKYLHAIIQFKLRAQVLEFEQYVIVLKYKLIVISSNTSPNG